MNKRARVAVAALLTLSAASVLVVLRTAERATRPTDIRQCIAGAQADADCLRELYLAAWEQGTLVDLQTVSDELESRSVGYDNSCHAASHEAGREKVRAADGPVDIAALRLLVRKVPPGMANRCLAGLLHGVIDELSLNSDAAAIYGELVEECVDAPISRLGDNGCGEGLGHMAWNVTADSDRGVRLCESFVTDTQRYTCVISVYMEKHFPRPEFSVHPVVPPPPPTEWYVTCERLRSTSPSFAQGCGGAAAYVWLRSDPLLDVYRPVFDKTASQKDRVDAALEVVEGLDRLCREFPNDEEMIGCFMQASSLPRDLLPECESARPAAKVSAAQYACRPVG